MKPPIFIEYYSHAGCDCYKILNPWPRFADEKMALYPVSDGYALAELIAIGVINRWLHEALAENPL